MSFPQIKKDITPFIKVKPNPLHNLISEHINLEEQKFEIEKNIKKIEKFLKINEKTCKNHFSKIGKEIFNSDT